MAMTWIWTGMVVLSLVFGLFTGNLDAVADAAMDGAASAVELSVSMAGILCLWSGVMEIMNVCGLSAGLARAFRPILRRLMPQASRDEKTLAALSANVSANLLGLGNAATPLGIQAARRMARGCSGTASDELCLLVVLNTASIQLLPATIASVRSASGAQSPFDILPAVWLASALSVVVGVLTAKFLAAVGGGVDGLMLQLLGILIGDPVGRGQLLAEQRCHVADGDAVFGGGDEAAAPACDAVARKLGRLALKQIGQLEAEGQRTLVQEGERQIDRAGLVASVFRFRHAGLFSHLLFGEAGDAAHLADTERDLHQGAYGGGRCCLGRHGGFLLQK